MAIQVLAGWTHGRRDLYTKAIDIKDTDSF